MMTKELHDKLTKYEAQFNTAINAQYVRAMNSVFAADFIQACRELNIYLNVNCPQCVLKAMQTLGKLYFEYREPEQPAVADSAELPDNLLPPMIPDSEDNKTIKPKKRVSQAPSKNKKK